MNVIYVLRERSTTDFEAAKLWAERRVRVCFFPLPEITGAKCIKVSEISHCKTAYQILQNQTSNDLGVTFRICFSSTYLKEKDKVIVSLLNIAWCLSFQFIWTTLSVDNTWRNNSSGWHQAQFASTRQVIIMGDCPPSKFRPPPCDKS